MKKLMIAAAIVCAAAVGNAANCVWGFTSDAIQGAIGATYVDEDGYMDGGTAFLFLGTVGITDGQFTGLDTATQLATSQQLGNYKYGSNGQKVNLADLANDTAGQAYTLVLVDANNLDSLAGYEGYAAIYNSSSTRGVNPQDETDHWAIMQTSTAFKPADWQSVPEPTSGLLLLLGVAGLALKRKRA